MIQGYVQNVYNVIEVDPVSQQRSNRGPSLPRISRYRSPWSSEGLAYRWMALRINLPLKYKTRRLVERLTFAMLLSVEYDVATEGPLRTPQWV